MFGGSQPVETRLLTSSAQNRVMPRHEESRLDTHARGKTRFFADAQNDTPSAALLSLRGISTLGDRGVPALEEAQRLKEVKEKTGRKYMMAESSYYRNGCIYARSLFQQGGFGEAHDCAARIRLRTAARAGAPARIAASPRRR